MNTSQYISRLNTLYHTGAATEHSYRGDLQQLLMDLLPDILVTNEPSRVSCGAPDYVLTRKEVPVGYIEAKDIGVNLHSKQLREQFDRYKAGLTNLIITDYLHFQFFREGEFVTEVRIGELAGGEIKPLAESFRQFEHLIKDFVLVVSQSIKSPTRLARMMAGKARLMADVIEKSLNADDAQERNTSLKSQKLSFQQMLIHDINNKSFADIYAQTIAYGMFAARYHDPTLPTFSRMEAAQLIPRSNPFLRKLFQDIAGFDLDDRLVWIVDELVNIFLASDVAKIMRNFGRATKQEDPVVHFYETFLGEYSPSLRKARGVWYTPQPVVNFIVRAVDDILKQEFGLPQGLADSSKTKISVKVPTHDKRFSSGMRDYEKEVHKVQILDPATGTGTFLSEVVKHIHKRFEGQQGIWSKYVNDNLIPRLNGFELLMASYAMAHLQMDMLLTETGYKPTEDQRFRIFLTNSLEEAHPDTGTLFSSWLSDEADQANAIKRDTPVMVVMGNPPYSVSSSNKGEWIESLTADYKKDLNERNIQPLSDDYIKFIRFGQHFIEKNGEGVLAYISNNSFIDGLIHKQMRKSLLETFDKIYILDLHGSSNKQEVNPEGGVDQNVFDIMQGVSINIFIKNKKSKDKIGAIFHLDLYGPRKSKYEFLLTNKFLDLKWNKISPQSPNYFFVPKNYDKEKEYSKGFNVSELFPVKTSGIKTHRDGLVTDIDPYILEKRMKTFFDLDIDDVSLCQKYNLREKKEWLNQKRVNKIDYGLIKPISFRPFDERYIYYSPDLIDRGREKVMANILNHDNLMALFPRQAATEKFGFFLSKNICDINYTGTAGQYGAGLAFPLYIFSEKKSLINGIQNKIPNLNKEIVSKIAENLALEYTYEKEDIPGTFAPIDLLDYIYAILHSPSYREKYKEFLKIDFPRIPYPTSAETFWQLVALGRELREIHLLESPVVENYLTGYPMDGDNVITRKITTASPGYEPLSETHGRVWINEQQYFDKVPLAAWEFYIGGYQPAQKWLKDRRGRELSYEDILHYQKIIVALSETGRIMGEIGKLEVGSPETEADLTGFQNL